MNIWDNASSSPSIMPLSAHQCGELGGVSWRGSYTTDAAIQQVLTDVRWLWLSLGFLAGFSQLDGDRHDQVAARQQQVFKYWITICMKTHERFQW
jgi:hypothetical protein